MPPLSFSHYRVESEIGRGGMGVVYRAYDERLRRPVAIKVLADEIAADPARRHRILEEARAACALNHPAITTVYDVGDQDGRLFIVMEYVDGRTLRALLSSGAIETGTLLRVGVEVAHALSSAHARGIVHGDIKPENVMVQADGRVKLLDFGIARRFELGTGASTGVLDGSAAQTSAGTLAGSGTLPYMAPELLTDGSADGRSDLFALGVLLYEAIAGKRPFASASTAGLIDQIVRAPPESLESAHPATPPAFARLVHELLAKDPRQRPQTATDAAARMSAALRAMELAAAFPPSIAGKQAVAVLPFRVLTPDPNDDYLSGALADALINRLSEGGTMLVRPTNTVMRYAREAVDPIAAGRELNVDVVVDGSVQRIEHRLRVHVQARRVADGAPLASSRHEADLGDLFSLQDAAGDAVAASLGLRAIRQSASASPPTTNLKAYELFLRANERLSRANRWDTRSAVDMLEAAVAADPRFADAWARLAEARAIMALTFDPDGPWLTLARAATRRALSLDRYNAAAHSAQGRILWSPAEKFKNRLALRAFAAALRINPGCRDALVWQGLVLMHVGMNGPARSSLTAALASNPDDGFAQTFLGQVALLDGAYEEADAINDRLLTIEPSNLYASLFAPMVAAYRGRFEEMDVRVRRAAEVIGHDPLLDSYHGLALAVIGHTKRAESSLKRALTGRSRLHTHHTFHISAAAHAVLGNKATAVALLKKAAAEGLPHFQLFRGDPHLASLAGFPPFERFMASLRRECAGYERAFVAGVNLSKF